MLTKVDPSLDVAVQREVPSLSLTHALLYLSRQGLPVGDADYRDVFVDLINVLEHLNALSRAASGFDRHYWLIGRKWEHEF